MKPDGCTTREALNATGAERIMVVEGYTSHCNLAGSCRLKLLGDTWHLQTIVELLSMLAQGNPHH